MRSVIVIALMGLMGTVAGCGGAATIMSKLSIEEFKPVPGTLPGSRLLVGTVTKISGDRIDVDTGEGMIRPLSIESGGEEARGLQVGSPVDVLINDHNDVIAYQKPAPVPPTQRFRGALGQPFNPEKERVTIRLDTGRDVGFYARSLVMEKLALLEVGETADFAVDRAFLIVDVFSRGKARMVPLGSSPEAPRRVVEGAFVTIGDGKVRLRTALDDIQTFHVRPLLQPAFERLAPNEIVSAYLDAKELVIDMVRGAARPRTAGR